MSDTRTWGESPDTSPALVEIDAKTLFLLGDVHAEWRGVRAVLRAAGILDPDDRLVLPPGAALVQVGDLVDSGRGVPVEPGALRTALDEAFPDWGEVLAPGPSGSVLGIDDVLASRGHWEAERLELERLALANAMDGLCTLRFFRRLAASGAPVVCLLGNHDVDLLRGNFRYFPRQKAWLLALAGLSPEDIAAHGRGEGSGARTCTNPDLAWLAGLPFLATGAGVLAVHGGPTHTLVRSLDLLGIRNLRDLAAYLERGRAAGFSHASLDEGASVLSPDSAADDFVHDADLCARFLALSGSRLLAVGHSPFLHFPKGQWQDLHDPEIASRVKIPDLLGSGGRVLKLDTNVKRGGPCWIIQVRAGEGKGVAVRADGLRRDLCPPTARAWMDEGPQRSEAPAEGVDAEAFGRVHRAIERLGTSPVADRLRACLETLVALGATDLSPVETAVALSGDPGSGAISGLEALTSQAVGRHAALLRELEHALDAAGGDGIAFVPAFEAAQIAGSTFHLGPAVARDLTDSGRSRGKWIVTASWFGDPSGTVVAVQSFTPDGPGPEARVPCGPWPPDDAAIARAIRDCTGLDPVVGLALSAPPQPSRQCQPEAVRKGPAPQEEKVEREARLPEGPPVTVPAVLTGLRAWGRKNARLLGLNENGDAAFHHVIDRTGRIVAGRFRLRTPAGVHGVLLIHGGLLIPVNTAFLDPASRFVVVRVPSGEALDADHATCLAGFMEEDPVRLYSAVTPEVLGLLRVGEVEALGLGDPRDPIWRRGRFLFASPDPAIAAYFFNKPCTARFSVPRSRFLSALVSGLVTVNLFLSDHGEPLDPTARFGAMDIGLEVVAIGSEGIAWLSGFLEFEDSQAAR